MIGRIGIVGGGQLGRMLTEAALPMGFAVTVVDATPGCPASQAGAGQIVGDLDDPGALAALAEVSDVVTWEVEHIGAGALATLAEAGHVVAPSPSMLEVVQDKLAQKQLLRDAGLPVADTRPFPRGADADEVARLLGDLGTPVVVKSRRGGYDGRGNHVFDGDLEALVAALGHDWEGLYAEATVAFDAELAVLVARGTDGSCATYPTVRTVQRAGICDTAAVPAEVPPAVDAAAQDVARRCVALLDGAGVFAVELFACGDAVVVNEIAPRVHNSGHLTIEACATSQFEQHIRAVAGLPLGSTALRAPAAAMVNILGREEGAAAGAGLGAALALPDVHVHLYGKALRPKRKIGHVTVLAGSVDEALRTGQAARRALPQ